MTYENMIFSNNFLLVFVLFLEEGESGVERIEKE